MAASQPPPLSPGPMQYLVVDRGLDTDDELSDWDAPVEIDLLDPPVPKNKVGHHQRSKTHKRLTRTLFNWTNLFCPMKKHSL